MVDALLDEDWVAVRDKVEVAQKLSVAEGVKDADTVSVSNAVGLTEGDVLNDTVLLRDEDNVPLSLGKDEALVDKEGLCIGERLDVGVAGFVEGTAL